MLVPVTQWRCDECGEVVSAEDGYVIWNRFNAPDFQFRVIHHVKCDNNAFPSSLALSSLLGPDGLAKLTSWLSYGPPNSQPGLPSRQECAGDYPIPPLDAWVDLMRRLHLPRYEESRPLYFRPWVWDHFSGTSESYPYLQDSIAGLLDEACQRELVDE